MSRSIRPNPWTVGILCAILSVASIDHASAKPKQTSTQETYVSFAAQIIHTEAPWENAATFKGLWLYPDFNALASRAPAHVDDCIEFLRAPNHDESQKLFAIYAMYKTPLPDYLRFVRKLFELADRGYIPARDLLSAIFPMTYITSKGVIFDNYNDPKVQTFLQNMLAWPGWSQSDRQSILWVKEGGDFQYRYRNYRDAILNYLRTE